MLELKIRYKYLILLCFVSVFMCFSCISKPVQQLSDNYIVVETTVDDDFTTLAKKYLNDADKGWLIAEFNGVTELKPGASVVIPLYPFKRGGVNPAGYQLVPVLSYQQFPSDSNNRENPETSNFEKHLDYLKKNNFQVISIGRLMDFLEYKSQIPKNSVVITINGVWDTFNDIELPLLTKFGYPATMFVETQNIGEGKSISWQMLEELTHKGIDIQNGSGLNVEQLIDKEKLSLKDYFEFIEKEISDSKKKIESEIGKECIYYAFPSGDGNNLVINILKKYGFKAAFNNSGGANPFYVDSYNINRTVVYLNCTMEEFKDKLTVFQDIDLN